MASEESSWVGEDYSVRDGGAQTQHSDQQVENFAQDSHSSGDAADNGSEDDGGDYDPESVLLESSHPVPPNKSSSSPNSNQQRSVSKPKMTGGFLVEASDEEEDEDETPGNSAQPGQSLRVPEQAEEPSNSNNGAQGAANTAPAPNGFPGIAGLDPVALLEARIKEDPRGDMDAWLNLIADHKRRNHIEALRNTYERFLAVFPQAADIWTDWIELELSLDQFPTAERIFGRCLMSVPNVRLWTVYLNYIRRRNDLTKDDPSGQARRTVASSYEFVIDNIGVDRDSGTIWQDYIQFVKSAPGQIGGNGWQDQQKMDLVRKAFHRAIAVPMSTVNNLWKEYDQFEMGLNKLSGRKFIQERSPGYMSAKSANIALDNITRNLKRHNLPRLPPAPGFDGDAEYKEQVDLWKKWLAWEKEDPLVLATDDPKAFRQRILYCYKQALMALRFCPEMWVDAAEWCFQNGETDTGKDMLLAGIKANPESVLLAFKQADYIEVNHQSKEDNVADYAKAVRQPFDDVLDTLYAMGDKVKEREQMEVATLKQAAATEESSAQVSVEQDDDDEERRPKISATEERIQAIQRGYAAESQLLSRTISYVWIALARAMRRIQGKGNQSDGGLRKVFTDARQRGRLTSDVYIAVALLESVVYKDPVGAKIFERGSRLFPTDEGFMIEYLKFLHGKDDTTNARVVFETCVNRLVSKPETLHQAKPLYAYFHKYESQFGERSQIAKLEDRMAELFPEDPRLTSFIARYSSDRFDPVAAPIIISKAVQMRPKQAAPVMADPAFSRPDSRASPPRLIEQSPRPQYARATASPKRPLGIDDEELNPPKRLARGASPLKGAAGRRLDQQRRNQASALHRDITFLLSILPPAHTYDGQRLNPVGLTNILRESALPDYSTWAASMSNQARGTTPSHGRQPSGDYSNTGRPISPFGGLRTASGGYRNSPLRTEAGMNPYEAPPDPNSGGAPPSWLPPSAPYGQPPPGQYPGYRY